MQQSDYVKYTATQIAILSLLADGQPHLRTEIHEKCIRSEGTQISVVRVHMHKLRKLLHRDGHELVCIINGGKIYYQHVVLLPQAQETVREKLKNVK